MNPVDTVPLMLFALHMLALGVVTIIFFGMIALHRRACLAQPTARIDTGRFPTNPQLMPYPTAWLAIRSSNSKFVQTVLGMSCPAPCPWKEGIAGKHELFIGSPVNHWIIVTGAELPSPGHDVDRAFRWLIRLSRVLGHVQFFMADPILHHHAWVRVENGSVQRAYAWAGETVWNQGVKTLAERELTMNCRGYGEGAEVDDGSMEKNAAANAQKVHLLAERWSINPMSIGEDWQNVADGIAGQSSLFHQD